MRLRDGVGRSGTARWILLSLLIAVPALALPALAYAHIERPSYWPNPRPDRSVTPAAGGEVPDARSLGSAVTGRGPGQVRVVCKGPGGSTSMQLVRSSIAKARDNGFRLRPSQEKDFLSRKEARRLRSINRALADDCDYHLIQQAIFDSGNNDRVVVMPGRYPERRSRRQPTNDPRCAHLTQDNGSGEEAPSYEYQATCPNDQNLVYIQGRKVGKKPPPEPPRANREGIPDLGRCVRCNLQLEGSGVKPTDVTIDAGKNYRRSGRFGPKPRAARGIPRPGEPASQSPGPGAKPGVANGCDFEPECSYAKDVVLRVDRADGFVGRNFLTKSSTEHGVYVEEVDGFLLNKTKFFWSAEYGNLTFTSDHGLYKNCDSYGAGDAAVYPGASPETGEDVENESFYPDAPRINTVVKHCDLRSSALAYSGSQGNAVRITQNEVYANTTGIVTDSISASGHPGYPPDSVVVDHNNIYSNNLDSYNNPPFVNTVGLPIGVGIMWPGVNSSTIRNNYIFDNWRRGTMLLAVPEGTTRGEPEDPSRSACEKPPHPPGGVTSPAAKTSCENTYRGNFMGMAPPGFKPSRAVDKFGNETSLDGGEKNGVDFWWDEFPGNEGNCWPPSNVGHDGTHASITADPAHNPAAHGTNVPGFLPEECDPADPTWELGIGTGDVVKEAVLANCALFYEPGDTANDHPGCDWFSPPPEPGTQAAAQEEREFDRQARRFRQSDEAAEMRQQLHSLSTIAPRR